METGMAMFGMVLWVLFASALVLCVTLGVVLSYHWFNYSMNRRMSSVAITVYATVCSVILIILLALALSL